MTDTPPPPSDPPGPSDPQGPGVAPPPPAAPAPPPPAGAPSGPWASDAAPGPWASDVRTAGAGQYAAPTQPASIATAVKLMYVGAALTVVGVLASFFQTDEIRRLIRESDSSLTDSEVDAGVAGFLAFYVVTGLISVGAWLWMAHTNGQGRSWARIVATVLGGLNIVFTLLGVAQGDSPAATTIVAVLGLIVAAAVLWYLWRPESTAYYEAQTPR